MQEDPGPWRVGDSAHQMKCPDAGPLDRGGENPRVGSCPEGTLLGVGLEGKRGKVISLHNVGRGQAFYLANWLPLDP